MATPVLWKDVVGFEGCNGKRSTAGGYSWKFKEVA